MSATTIKVSPALRDRLNDEARRRKTTAAGVVEALLSESDRHERFRMIREARASMTPTDREAYDLEVKAWDSPALGGVE